MSFVAFIGEPVLVPENIQVTIDCGPSINQASKEAVVSQITWRKNGRVIVNGSEVNVVLAPDNRTIVIIDTLLGTPAKLGTDGIYECEVCGAVCFMNVSTLEICSKYITR